MSEQQIKKRPLSMEDYNTIKEYMKENSSKSYFLLFVLITEYGFIASDLLSLQKKNVQFNGEDYIFTTEYGRVTHVPKEIRPEMDILFHDIENDTDYFFHTENYLKIQQSNFSNYLKNIAEKFYIEDLSCRFLSSFITRRKRINTAPVFDDFSSRIAVSAPDKSPAYSVDYCVAFTNLVNQLNNKLLQIEKIDSTQKRANEQKRLLSYMEKFTNKINE